MSEGNVPVYVPSTGGTPIAAEQDVDGNWRQIISSPDVVTAITGNPEVAPTVGGTAVSASNPLPVNDHYTAFDNFGGWQLTNGGVLTFTASSPCDLIWVRIDDGSGAASVATCDPSGGTPTATTGIPLDDGIDKPITIRTQTVKVYSSTSSKYVKVWGFRA